MKISATLRTSKRLGRTYRNLENRVKVEHLEPQRRQVIGEPERGRGDFVLLVEVVLEVAVEVVVGVAVQIFPDEPPNI